MQLVYHFEPPRDKLNHQGTKIHEGYKALRPLRRLCEPCDTYFLYRKNAMNRNARKEYKAFVILCVFVAFPYKAGQVVVLKIKLRHYGMHGFFIVIIFCLNC